MALPQLTSRHGPPDCAEDRFNPTLLPSSTGLLSHQLPSRGARCTECPTMQDRAGLTPGRLTQQLLADRDPTPYAKDLSTGVVVRPRVTTEAILDARERRIEYLARSSRVTRSERPSPTSQTNMGTMVASRYGPTPQGEHGRGRVHGDLGESQAQCKQGEVPVHRPQQDVERPRHDDACREGHEICGDVLRGPLCVTTHDERAARFGMTSSRSGSPQRRSGSVANTPDREPEDDRQFADRRGR